MRLITACCIKMKNMKSGKAVRENGEAQFILKTEKAVLFTMQ